MLVEAFLRRIGGAEPGETSGFKEEILKSFRWRDILGGISNEISEKSPEEFWEKSLNKCLMELQ